MTATNDTRVQIKFTRNVLGEPTGLEVTNSWGLKLWCHASYNDQPLLESQLRSLGETIVGGARAVGATVEWIEDAKA